MSWDINSLVYTNYIFFICIKKQYTFFFQRNLKLSRISLRVIKNDFFIHDLQYCYF